MTVSTVDPSQIAPDETNPIIGLRDVQLNLRSAAGEVNILRGISLDINAGDMVGIVGPSGAGKSTLMMLIGGLESASSGQVMVAGRDLSALDEDALAEFRRDNVGIVFQAFRLIPTMTAMENVAIPLELAGEENAFEKARESLGRVGLADRVEHYPDQLSGGEQQRVAIARAFVSKPALLLADEPTGNLDRATGDEVVELLFDLRARHGTTLVLITHDEALARRCDRVIRMGDGLIIEESDEGASTRKSA
ncbi:MAG: ABC transporter ATP-binding protein [Alphaproteobacteria bacterium]|nr:ABC transporter ATP-binding protein [Alphaproteobacteria bacterium]